MRFKCTLLMILCLLSLNLSAQFIVLKVNGEVKDGKGNLLVRRAEITQNTTLHFKDKESFCTVINIEKGGKVHLAPPLSLSDQLIAAVKDCIVAPKTTSMLGTKGNENIESLDQLNAAMVLSVSDAKETLWIVDSAHLSLSMDGFELNDSSFFYLEYESGDEVVRKKLPSKGKTVLISPEIYLVDGSAILPLPELTTLFFVNLKEGKQTELGKMRWRFLSKKELKAELILLRSAFPKIKKDTFLSTQAYAFVKTHYGHVDEEGLAKTIDEIFDHEN